MNKIGTFHTYTDLNTYRKLCFPRLCFELQNDDSCQDKNHKTIELNLKIHTIHNEVEMETKTRHKFEVNLQFNSSVMSVL